MSPFVGLFFALATGSLWLSTILIGRSLWGNLTGALIKVVVAAGLGFIAVGWPLIALQGVAAIDFNSLILGGLGSGAAVISFFFKFLLEENGS